MRLPFERLSSSAQHALRIVVATIALTAIANVACAQLISPVSFRDTTQPSGRSLAPGHVMFGYAGWDYGTDALDRIIVEAHEGTVKGVSRSGAIIAADVPIKRGTNVTMTVGGWYNNGGTRTLNDPEHIYRESVGGTLVLMPARVMSERSRFASVYGSVFYKWVGVQAGIVPVQIKQTLDIASIGTTTSNRSQTDFDAFGVMRYTDTDPGWPPVTLTLALGVYRYAARGPSLLVNGLYEEGSATPASKALSAFVNISVSLTRHLAFDLSGWVTEANDKTLNDSQNRATVGLGITF